MRTNNLLGQLPKNVAERYVLRGSSCISICYPESGRIPADLDLSLDDQSSFQFVPTSKSEESIANAHLVSPSFRLLPPVNILWDEIHIKHDDLNEVVAQKLSRIMTSGRSPAMYAKDMLDIAYLVQNARSKLDSNLIKQIAFLYAGAMNPTLDAGALSFDRGFNEIDATSLRSAWPGLTQEQYCKACHCFSQWIDESIFDNQGRPNFIDINLFIATQQGNTKECKKLIDNRLLLYIDKFLSYIKNVRQNIITRNFKDKPMSQNSITGSNTPVIYMMMALLSQRGTDMENITVTQNADGGMRFTVSNSKASKYRYNSSYEVPKKHPEAQVSIPAAIENLSHALSGLAEERKLPLALKVEPGKYRQSSFEKRDEPSLNASIEAAIYGNARGVYESLPVTVTVTHRRDFHIDLTADQVQGLLGAELLKTLGHISPATGQKKREGRY